MMSLKLWGALLILAATSATGFYVALNLARRPRQLAELGAALSLLESEIGFAATPLPQALRQLGAAGSLAGQLFVAAAGNLADGQGRTAGEAYGAALTALAPSTALQAEDLLVLQSLVPVLGATDREDQLRHLRLCRERLSRQEAQAREQRERYEMMPKYLGVLFGLGLVIILL